MPAQNKATEFLSGKLYWAKVFGAPRLNYSGDGREWAFEFEPDEKGVATLKKHGLADRLKNKHEDRGAFLVLKKPEFNKMGEPNPKLRVYDDDNNAWDEQKLIGNASDADVKIDIRDYGVGKKKGVYPVAIRVTRLVPYQSTEFGSMDKGFDDSEADAAKPVKAAAKKAAPKFDDDLNDEIPF